MTPALQATIRRRLASERGARFQPGAKRVCLLYPSPYRAAMSSLGFQQVHRVLEEAGFAVERAFLPDDEHADDRGPLVTYETQTPVSHFPVVGVSLAYELELAGLVKCLDQAGIARFPEDRTKHDPLVVLGGPLTFSNPLPAGPYVDAMILGEAEESVVGAFEAGLSGDREELISTIVQLPGGYVPSLHGEQLPAIAKAPDDQLPARSRIWTPEAELSDMFLMEGERGCHRQCTFCVMRRSTNGGMRLVTPDRLMGSIPGDAPRVGLVGAAISDHPKLVPLLQAIVDSGRGVGVSSLRADRIALKPDIARLLREGGYRTLTVASDAPSQRLRRTIMKGTTERHLVACAEQAAEHRYSVLKVYMMVGVPDETDDDIDELVRFTNELGRIHPVALGIAPFVAKRNTPLDGAPFAGIKIVERRLKRIQRGLDKRASARPTSARWAAVEHALAQGGFDEGRAVARAVDGGGRFAAWRRALIP